MFFFFMVGSRLEYMKKEEIISEIGKEEINRASIEKAIYSLLSKKDYESEIKKGRQNTYVIFSEDISDYSVEVKIHVNPRSSVEVNIF